MTTPSPSETSPKTLFEKVWDAHLIQPETDAAPALVYIDLHLIHEVTSQRRVARLGAS